jgi:hypothetical protein
MLKLLGRRPSEAAKPQQGKTRSQEAGPNQTPAMTPSLSPDAQPSAPSVSGTLCEVFISVHVASLGAVAKQLKQAIEAQGRSVFLCTDLSGGVNFRDEIIQGVKACKVFVPLMNAEWASSGECESEFLLAKRLNLTSHERKLTSPPAARRPIILPVAFPNLNTWARFPRVELLAATTNFVRVIDCLN